MHAMYYWYYCYPWNSTIHAAGATHITGISPPDMAAADSVLNGYPIRISPTVSGFLCVASMTPHVFSWSTSRKQEAAVRREKPLDRSLNVICS